METTAGVGQISVTAKEQTLLANTLQDIAKAFKVLPLTYQKYHFSH